MTDALFTVAESTARTLTRAYAAALYRGNSDTVPTYTPVSGPKDCDECFGRQAETGGQLVEGGGVRARAKLRRAVPGNGTNGALLLCHEHAHLWRERDRADGVPAGRP